MHRARRAPSGDRRPRVARAARRAPPLDAALARTPDVRPRPRGRRRARPHALAAVRERRRPRRDRPAEEVCASRPRSWPSSPRRARCARTSAPATSGTTSSTTRASRGASRAPRSRPSSTRARCNAATRRTTRSRAASAAVRLDDGTTWRPSGGSSGGTLRDALAFSKNAVAVRLTQEVGAHRVALVAQRMGITSPLDVVPSTRAGHEPGDAAGDGRRVRRDRQRRARPHAAPGHADRDRVRPRARALRAPRARRRSRAATRASCST